MDTTVYLGKRIRGTVLTFQLASLAERDAPA